MPDSIESALLIQLAGTLQWSAAIPPVNQFTGTLTAVDPGAALDVSDYARRDRELQHRDMIAAAAVAKVSIFARTVWNGTVVQPVLQGVTRVTDSTGTNVVMPLDPSQVGASLPNNSTAVQYVLNADIPYAAVTVTDVALYNRDLMLFETLARASTIFPNTPPITQIDPNGIYIGSTSVWATAQGVNVPKVPNAAEPMNQATFKDPDLYLSERDNQVAAYVSRVVQALKNPFEFAARIYVQVNSTSGVDVRESETYVLTDNVFIPGNVYTAGEQVLYQGVWYEANATTTDVPPSANWTQLANPTRIQFLADPSLDSRNRIVYDRQAKTLQWFRETLDLIHIPQIVGFFIPGILPNQIIQTVASVPERKDAQFYRLKAARIETSTGTYQPQEVFNPTGNRDPSSTFVTGGLNTVFQGQKYVTLPTPDSFVINFQNLYCTSGTYRMDCLVRPSPNITVAGGDNDQGSLDPSDGGTTYGAIGDVRNWEIALPAGGWKLFIDFSNASGTSTNAFGIKATQGATSIFTNALPLYYTDAQGDALPPGTVISSPGIDIQSTGQVYNFAIQWTAGLGQLHISQLRLQQVGGPDTSHYIMQASWLNSVSTVAETETVLGGDAEGVTPTGDGGVDYSGFNSPLNWLIALDPGSWQMTIDYSNAISDGATEFDIQVSQPGLSAQNFILPYTNGTNGPLPQDTLVTSQNIGIISNGQPFTLGIAWLPPAGGGPNGRFHIRDMTFTLHSSQNSISRLDVFGQANNPDVMPFQFFLSGTSQTPQIQVVWLPKSASVWQAKSYNFGDQVLYNLVYWQANTITQATDIPGQSTVWTALGIEPQIPLVIEQVQLSKLVATTPTPDITGFQGFRQDMLERALRADQDAYTTALKQTGTLFPEFRDTNDSWTFTSTGSWMSFMEVYAPRLRQAGTVASDGIVPGRQYGVATLGGEQVFYNGGTFTDGQKFYGVAGFASYTTTGNPVVSQIGAYRLAQPGDIGQTGLIPAGIEYVRFAGTGTVHGWYPSYASYPTHQAVQPWMIEQGFYVTDSDFGAPDGNIVPQGTADNPILSFGNETVYFVHGCSNGTLGFDGTLPPWITFDGGSSRLIGEADSFFGRSQAAANSIAQLNLNSFGTNELNDGDLFCPIGPSWGDTVWTLVSNTLGGGAGANISGSYSGATISVSAKGNGSPSSISRGLGTLSYTGPQANCRARVTITEGPTVYMGFFIEQDGTNRISIAFGTNGDPLSPGNYDFYFTILATGGSTIQIIGIVDAGPPARGFIDSFDSNQGTYTAVIENVV